VLEQISAINLNLHIIKIDLFERLATGENRRRKVYFFNFCGSIISKNPIFVPRKKYDFIQILLAKCIPGEGSGCLTFLLFV
jgi:hypothetical protein